jgi:hypothetical protein
MFVIGTALTYDAGYCVTGRRAAGAVFPVRTLKTAVPPDWPGKPAQRIAETFLLESKGVSSFGDPSSDTTTGLPRAARVERRVS